MKEIRSIVEAWRTIDPGTTQAALATVVRVEGSSYRRAGARMLVLDNGTYLGGISGGCLEGDALRRARKGIALGRSSVITYDTTQDDDYQIGVGLGCQGIIDVLFTPLRPDEAGCPLRILSGVTGIRRPVAVVTVTGSPDERQLGRTFLYEEGQLPDLYDERKAEGAEVVAAIGQALKEGRSRSRSFGETRLFIEVILPAIHVVVYGGNYDIRTLLRQTAELGWDSTAVLNTGRVAKELTAAATTVLDSRSGSAPLIDDYTAVLLMSHDYRTDTANLRLVLPSAASYIGLLGPRKRAQKIFEAFAEGGQPLGEAELRRIYAPAGLDLGAATPEEIALSILAEVRSHFAGRPGGSLRLREGSIYDHGM
jgi:xanthine dehydrogenase accessory factor